jgi:5-carboxymethyl-2-hydroxymuconate isomerase
MPHIVIHYTAPLAAETDFSRLCRGLADAMLAQRDEAGKPVFPPGGVRVYAVAAEHHAVGDGAYDDAFVYLNLRMARGRSPAVVQRVGAALAEVTRAHFAPLLATRPLGLTFQVDEGAEVFDAKLGNLHARYAAGAAKS